MRRQGLHHFPACDGHNRASNGCIIIQRQLCLMVYPLFHREDTSNY